MATNVSAKATKFSVTNTKFHVPVVTLSTHDNVKVLEEIKFGF